MSQSITFFQFDEANVNATWDELIATEFDPEVVQKYDSKTDNYFTSTGMGLYEAIVDTVQEFVDKHPEPDRSTAHSILVEIDNRVVGVYDECSSFSEYLDEVRDVVSFWLKVQTGKSFDEYFDAEFDKIGMETWRIVFSGQPSLEEVKDLLQNEEYSQELKDPDWELAPNTMLDYYTKIKEVFECCEQTNTEMMALHEDHLLSERWSKRLLRLWPRVKPILVKFSQDPGSIYYREPKADKTEAGIPQHPKRENSIARTFPHDDDPAINLTIQQSWLEKSSESALETFKSTLGQVLDKSSSDGYLSRWHVTRISEADTAYLVYDEHPVAALRIQDKALHLETAEGEVPRYEDIMFAIRHAAKELELSVYSNVHHAHLPQDPSLSIDHTYFSHEKSLAEFFAESNFIPRFALERIITKDDKSVASVIYPPYYAENREDGSIHILNNYMLDFLTEKHDQDTNQEFSYRVADSLDDFAKKHDLALVPIDFYQNYGLPTRIINETYFDVFNINRKVFVDPYVWDFDDDHHSRYFKNTETGVHLMDKVRKGENIDTTFKRILREELQVADDYVGARIWGIEFDRDRNDVLTPRLKVNIFVHGMTEKKKSQSHDWVSLG